MATDLFTERSIWTMLHGIVLGGGALLGLAAALYALVAMRSPAGDIAALQGRTFAWLTTFIAAALWLTVIVGTYVSFPPYRATPPDGLADLAEYPRSLLMSNPGTAWLHSFAMEVKEHMPWIAAMIATSVAFVSMRYRGIALQDRSLRRMTTMLLAICFLLVSLVAMLGILINKVAPLD